jgi:hypothetical protein
MLGRLANPLPLAPGGVGAERNPSPEIADLAIERIACTGDTSAAIVRFSS